MCGIAGIYRFRGDGDDAASVARMLGRLERRGPNDQGVEILGRSVLGNRRLAILDLSSAGHQPMLSRSGRYVVTFNGEIYNHQELLRDLGVDRATLRSRSDTEVLLLAWERWGEDALQRFVGQWAFALYDTREAKLWLARDRFGEKPLFHHENSERLAFASSLEALLQAHGTPRELDPGSLAEYLTLRYVVSPRTVLCEVRKLPGGHLLEVGPSGILAERAWYRLCFRHRETTHRRHAALDEEFHALFTRACERCLVSDVPVALLLSDGIDSNALRAALSERGHSPPAFTYRLRGAEPELPVVRTAGVNGEIINVGVSVEQCIESMDCAFSSLTEPVGDGVALATWMLIRNARERATVFLCGHGGDEVLGGYRLSQDRFRLAVLRNLALLPDSWARGTLDRFLYGDEPLAERRAALRRARPCEAPGAARYLIHRPLPAGDVCLLLGKSLHDSERYLGTVDRLYADCNHEAADLDRMQQVLMRTFLPEDILSFADSVSMGSSAELRMPYLDRDLVEFALSLAPQERVSPRPGRSNTKLVLRRWARSRLPREIVSRRKGSFQSGNVSELLRHDGQSVRARILEAPALRRNLPGAETWLTRPADSYRGPWEGTLWALLALGVWCQAVGAK
jgi:asparagine synthase (glutamine-hydrolysing)